LVNVGNILLITNVLINANEISFISLLKAESKKPKAFQFKHIIGSKALALPKD